MYGTPPALNRKTADDRSGRDCAGKDRPCGCGTPKPATGIYMPSYAPPKYHTAKNKWLIAHEEAAIEGAFNGLKGENVGID